MARTLPLHRLEEIRIGFGVLELREQELDGRELVHRVQHFAQHPHLLQLVGLGEELFLTRARAIDVDGRE